METERKRGNEINLMKYIIYSAVQAFLIIIVRNYFIF